MEDYAQGSVDVSIPRISWCGVCTDGQSFRQGLAWENKDSSTGRRAAQRHHLSLGAKCKIIPVCRIVNPPLMVIHSLDHVGKVDSLWTVLRILVRPLNE